MANILSAGLIAAALIGAVPAAASPPPRPKLIVAISVDQFADGLFQRYRESFTGGLARLARGARFTGYQSHAATETCPGHSTLLTGMHPNHTGIVANTWFDVKTGSSIYCVATTGDADPNARGPQNLKVDTLGGWMKRATPATRVIAVSGKDRAAITMAGHHGNAVYWWVDGLGFTTSTHAGPAGPLVTKLMRAFDAATFAAWAANPPALWPEASPAECEALQKPYTYGAISLSGKVPPEQATGLESARDFLKTTTFQDQLHSTTLYDQLVLDFATKLIAKPPSGPPLGRGRATDLLALSLSATDYVGHRFGNGGAEMCTHLHALDAALGRFLAHLDGLKIPYVVMLTADHGAIDAPERAKDNGFPRARRINNRKLVDDLNRYLEKELDLSYEPVVGDDPQQLILNLAGNDAALRARLRDAAIRWLRKRDDVDHVYTREEIAAAVPKPGTPPDKLSFAERYHESFDPARGGDIIVTYAEFATLGWPVAVGDYIGGHGSPWDYDRRVPILFWWPGITPSAPGAPIETVDIAPTLAAIAHAKAPPVDGRCVELGQGCPK